MIEFRILDPHTTPPGGWVYKQPETGVEFKGYARDAFFLSIQQHRLGNGIPISPLWKEEIEDAICRSHPEWGRQICTRAEPLAGARKPISFAAMQSFLNVVTHWMASLMMGEEPFVTQDEANRRAAICASCEFNADLGFSCGACADRLFQALGRIFRAPRKTPYDQHLGGCAICSCALKVAVWVPLRVQQAGLNEELRQEFRGVPYCWKRENL